MHDSPSLPPIPASKFAYRKAEAAALLSMSLRTLDNLICRKEITVRRVGRRVLIPATSIRAFLLVDHVTKAA